MDKSKVDKIIAALRNGCVGVLPTDTIYGVVCSALNREAVDKVYTFKRRERHKKLILLVGELDQLPQIGVYPSNKQVDALNTVWPGPHSAELPCAFEEYEYLHNGTGCVAVRMPKPEWLRNVIIQTGPIVATSANASGELTPSNVEDIKKQLPGLDFYYEGVTGDVPSSLVRVHPDGRLEWLKRS